MDVQWRRKALRCQATTVSGLTRIRAACQRRQDWRRATQTTRSAAWEPGVAPRPHQDGNLLAKGQVLKDQVRAGVAEDSKGLEQDGQHQVQGSHGSAC